MKNLLMAFLLLIVAILASCTDPKAERREYLLTEMQQIKNYYSLISQDLQNYRQQQGHLQNQLNKQQAELKDYNRQVEAYIMNHKMAIAALTAGAGGAAIAYDPNNEFSDDVQGTAGLVGVIAGLYALNNLEEVTAVADQLMQSSRHVKNLKSHIESTKAQLSNTYQPISHLQSSLSEMEDKYNKYKTEYDSLR